MQREIIEEKLLKLQTRQLILFFVERLIHDVSIFSNSKFANIQDLGIRSSLFTRGEFFESQNSIKFACCVIQHAVLAD